jgi:hypothetical protein
MPFPTVGDLLLHRRDDLHAESRLDRGGHDVGSSGGAGGKEIGGALRRGER